MSSYARVVDLLKRVHAGEVEPPQFALEAALALFVSPGEAPPPAIFPPEQVEKAREVLALVGGFLIQEPWGLIVSDDDAVCAEIIAPRFGGDQDKALHYLNVEMKAFNWDETQKP